MVNQDKDKSSGKERRRFPRVLKNFILNYSKYEDPAHKYELTQIKNVSLGGLCFVTCQPFEKGTQLHLELQTPYLSEKTNLKGVVLQSHEKIKGILYETRIEFVDLDPDVEYILKQVVDFFLNYQGKNEDEKD